MLEQNRVHLVIDLQGVGDDDQGRAGRNVAAVAESGDGVGDGLAGLLTERDHEGTDPAGEGESPADLVVRGEGIDRGAGAEEGCLIGSCSALGEDHDERVLDRVSQLNSGAHSVLLFEAQVGIGGVTQSS